MTSKTLLTRLESATLLNRSKQCLLNYHGKKLHPVKGPHGEWLYDREEVERLAAVLRMKGKRGGPRPKEPGDVAREVFRLFDLGAPLSAIVINLSVTPERVRELHLEYQTGYERPLPVQLTHEQKLAQEKANLEKEKLEVAREKIQTRRRRSYE
jgi:hypothetical protein